MISSSCLRVSSSVLGVSVCATTQLSRSIQPSRSTACLPVSLPDGLSQSLECSEDFKTLVVALGFSFLYSLLSCQIPGCSLYTFSLLSLLLLFFLFFTHSLSPSLRPSLPGCLQPWGSSSWPGRRICQHIFSSLAVRNVRHRL